MKKYEQMSIPALPILDIQKPQVVNEENISYTTRLERADQLMTAEFRGQITDNMAATLLKELLPEKY